MNISQTSRQLKALEITSENFQRFGQVIFPGIDGAAELTEARLNLQNGTPRFYIMRLQGRGLKFHTITRHMQCTQCLGSLEGKEWFIAVCPPNDNTVPVLADIAAFRIPGNCFIKLEIGTWHAGPYFESDFVDFYSLELNDTNIVDHCTHDFLQSQQLDLKIV